jgi:hypothetical protein
LDAFLLLICFRVFDSKAFFGILSWIKGTVCAKHRNGAGNSLSQSLTALPAPSGREPLAHPKGLHFSRKLYRYAKGPILEGAGIERSEMTGGVFLLPRKKRLPEQTFLCGASFFTASRTACR